MNSPTINASFTSPGLRLRGANKTELIRLKPRGFVYMNYTNTQNLHELKPIKITECPSLILA